MKKEMTREEMIKLIASDYGFGEEITKKIKTEVLRDVCKASQSYLYLKNLIEFGGEDIYLDE